VYSSGLVKDGILRRVMICKLIALKNVLQRDGRSGVCEI
jgi:hypothetical protein